MEYPLKIFYDGACGVCSKEMTYYMSIADQRVEFIDISAKNFRAKDYGKSNDDFQSKLHARDNKGTFYTGVDAFRRLWDSLPHPFYPLLSTLIGMPIVHFSARFGYSVFSRYRHLLPRKKNNVCHIN